MWLGTKRIYKQVGFNSDSTHNDGVSVSLKRKYGTRPMGREVMIQKKNWLNIYSVNLKVSSLYAIDVLTRANNPLPCIFWRDIICRLPSYLLSNRGSIKVLFY